MLLLCNKYQQQNDLLASFATCLCKRRSGHTWTQLQTHHLNDTRTVNLALVQCECHTGNWTVTANMKWTNKSADFRCIKNLFASLIQFPGVSKYPPPSLATAYECCVCSVNDSVILRESNSGCYVLPLQNMYWVDGSWFHSWLLGNAYLM